MRNGTSSALDEADRRRLEAIAADRNAPQNHVWRARIVLPSADGVGTNGIMAATGTGRLNSTPDSFVPADTRHAGTTGLDSRSDFYM